MAICYFAPAQPESLVLVLVLVLVLALTESRNGEASPNTPAIDFEDALAIQRILK